MSKQTIGEFLATQRKAKGYTQQYVSDMLGISNRTLSAWETNRAYPDILILPALAELYGVTADEIINGERNTNATANETEISEKSQLKLFRSKIAKNSSRYTLLLCAGVGAAVLFAIGSIMIPTAYSVLEWVINLLIAVGVIATVTVFTMLFIFSKNTLTTAGIYSASELSSVEGNFILKCANQSARVANIIGKSWFGCGIIMGLIWVLFLTERNIDQTAIGILVFFGIPVLIGLIILITTDVIEMITIKKYGTADQIKISKRNIKLFFLCSIPLIPFCAYLIVSLELIELMWYTLFINLLWVVFSLVFAGVIIYVVKHKKHKIAL